MNSITLKFDFRIVSGLLLVIIIGLLVAWQPWSGTQKRTISIAGQSTVKGSPDEFIFSPVYEKKAKDSSTAISEVSKTGNEVAGKLQELGVAEKNITTNVTTQKGYEPLTGREATEVTALFSLTAKLNDQAAAQKVLDYLVTTNPLYGVSPQSIFAKETRQKLEDQARGQALAAARAKAEQTATELDVKLGRVVSVSEPQWSHPILFESNQASPAVRDSAATTSPVLLIGEQEVSYTVTVGFQIR